MEKGKLSNIQRLKNLGIGESDSFPVASTPSIRAVMGTYEKIWGKKFTTSTTVSPGHVIVTRTA